MSHSGRHELVVGVDRPIELSRRIERTGRCLGVVIVLGVGGLFAGGTRGLLDGETPASGTAASFLAPVRRDLASVMPSAAVAVDDAALALEDPALGPATDFEVAPLAGAPAPPASVRLGSVDVGPIAEIPSDVGRDSTPPAVDRVPVADANPSPGTAAPAAIPSTASDPERGPAPEPAPAEDTSARTDDEPPPSGPIPTPVRGALDVVTSTIGGL